MRSPIPRKIHRVWLGSEMPADYVEYGRSWERLHPGWEVRTWGDADLDWLENRAEFERAPRFTTKANVARYEILHREGGVYVDCDFEALRPIDDLLDGASLVIGEERVGRYNNAWIAATPGHPVLRYAIDELPRSFAGRFDDLSTANTGPGFWTRCVRRAGVGPDDAPRVLGRDVLYPYGYDPAQRHLRQADFGAAYAVHHWADDQHLVPGAEPPASALARGVRPPANRPARLRARARAEWEPRLAQAGRRLATLVGTSTWGTFVGGNRVLVRTRRGIPMLAFADDLGVTPTLLASGDYDPRFLRFLARTLERGDVVVDVGANIGLFTVEMARRVGPTGRVFAYEPQPEVHALLADNVYLNTVGGNIGGEVIVRSVALGERAGAATMAVRSKHRGMGTIANDAAGSAPGTVDRHEVEVAVLDDELAGITEVKLVKVDVEGAELGVLQGMTRLLAEHRVRMVDVGLVDVQAGASWDALGDELRRWRDELGATFATIGPEGELRPILLEGALHHDVLGHLVVELPPG